MIQYVKFYDQGIMCSSTSLLLVRIFFWSAYFNYHETNTREKELNLTHDNQMLLKHYTCFEQLIMHMEAYFPFCLDVDIGGAGIELGSIPK